ncbi:hypothetical protein ABB37_01913 [Leptomonas pyrrhocoris]|uniref:Leucine-rich repeat protein n=1 Tax=Leptomonas pyrrhocoris TaxID=157538 RepID=A0A0N0DY21_LEPPY|nr:hypothetical protein ABB37_01913 [Leptomonas pyrrhocoris]KPA83645.1 hypothetical protein ABB37_01913 [Leptomonas pyrrhocoris]|eukprot:XP_015662084.1 hypothetical protein ABB37_01913 [Leptomonas pyrrhocoris]
MLRAEAITAGEGENLQGERSRGFACERKGGSAERSTAHPTDSDTPDSKRPTRRRSDHVDTHVTPTAAPAPPSPSTTASKHDRSSVLPPAAALPSVLPSPVTELYVHGGAASTALASLLPGHPEVRAVRLTHAALSPTQLRDLARYCPDVTRLSLAMNDDLHSTSFLCPTPSDTSSPTNTTATNTTTTTKMFSTAQQSQHPSPLLPPPPLPPTGNTHSPRSAFFVSKSAGPPPPGEAHVIPAPPPCGNGAAADEQRGGLLRPPPLSLSLPLPPPPAAATVASARSPDVPTARSSDSFTVDADDDQNTQSVRSNLADGTVHSRSTQAPPLQLPVQQRQVLLPLRRASQDALHNSQIDLFAAEEEGEAEMRMSLWQAAQTDVAERRQAVFILRPSDVVLGDAGEEGDDGGGDKGTKDSCLAAPAPSPPPPLSSSRPQNSANTVGGGVLPNSDGAVLAAATAAAAEKEEKEGETQPRPPLSFLVSASDDDASAVASTDTAAPLPPLSLSASTQHTDPLRLPDAVSRSVDATLAEMRTSLGKRSARTTSAYKGGVRIATATNASLPAATATATATTPSAASHARLRHRRSSSPRKGSSTHWSETLIDLDLSYTQVRDVSAARDVPQLQMLSRLSLEGCMQLTRVRWLPSLQHLRELNLSFSSVQGSAMYPLGFCARLEWLKLEGCSSFTCIDQLWVTAEVPKDESPSLQTDQRTLESTTGTTRATEQLSSAHLVRHRIAGGIPAITVLPASASRLASFSVATSDRGEDEAGTAPADTSPSTTPTASSAGAARPSPPPPSSGVSDAIDAAAAGAAEAAPAPLLSTLRVLIATSTGLTDAGLRPLRHIESLECVVVDRCAALTDINVAAELPALHTLDASHTGVTTSGLSALRHSRTLRLLRLQGCLSLTRLPVLFVEPTSARTGTAVSAGAGGGGGDDGNGGRASRVTAPRLSVIDVSLCSNLSAGGVEGLVMDAAAVQLEEAAATAATDGHRGQPAPTIEANSGGKPAHRDASLPLPLPYALPQLRHLFLRSCDALSQLTALRGFTRVVELDLYHTNIDAAALTTATAWWTSLEVLNVASTRVCTLAAWCPAEDMRGERKADGGALGGCADPVEGNHRPATGADASPTALPDADFLTTSKLPLFACTLRVLTLSNTDVTADGLRALQHFPRVEVLQLSSCRRLTSLSFLCLRADAPEVREGGGRMKERVALQEEQQLQQQRTALRELTVTEAVELTNVTTFPYLAACPRLRVLSLSGCTQLGGGGDAPSASATSAAPARPLTEHLPPLVGTITSNSNCSAKDSSFAVLQRMSGLTDLNLSKTAVTHDDLRAVLMPPSMRAVESLQANAASPADRATTRSPYSPLPHPQPASTSLQRIWLRGCRHLDEDGLLAAAAAAAVSEAEAAAAANGNATGTSGVFPQEKNTHVFLASVREVFLSQGRFGAAVLSSLVPRCVE